MGDFNVDVVIALGITKREELDKVIVEQVEYYMMQLLQQSILLHPALLEL